MQLLQKLLNKLNGLHYKQDYLCLSKESFQPGLFIFIVSDKGFIDITDRHLFVGYSPLIFAFRSLGEIHLAYEIDVVFTLYDLITIRSFNEKDVIAKLSFIKIDQLNDLCFYEGKKGEHSFISKFHQQVIAWQNRFYNKKPGNVYLKGNLLKQVQIAYSIPRIISLITVSDGHLCNLFPTDLHGQIDEVHYVISLRQKGKAAKQVDGIKKILISEVSSSQYEIAYALGKNHMQELKPKTAFPFSENKSERLHLLLPDQTTLYRELELISFFDHGIHRLFLFRIINKSKQTTNVQTLSHIHNSCATWRRNKGLPGNYLLR